MTDTSPIGKILRRSVTVERDRLATRAAGDDRIPISISSEEPVDRMFGREILVHTRDAINLDHARDGLPFLADHDGTRQLGLVEDVHLRADGKLAGRLRKGNHPDASWYFKDIESGIRSNISVGYQINDLSPDENDAQTFRAIRWTPMEVSTVSVPADINVGVGRSALPYNRGTMSTEEQQHGPGPQAVTLGDQREEIADIVRLANEHGMAEQVPSWLQRGLNRQQVQSEILTRKKGSAQAFSVGNWVDIPDREMRKFNPSKAILAILDNRWQTHGGLEKEISDTVGSRMSGGHGNSFYMPFNLPIATRTSLTGNIAGTSSLGGAGVQTYIMPLIEILRNKMLFTSIGSTVLTGLTGNISFPRSIVSNTMAWEGENPSTPHALSAGTFDNVTMSPKTAMASSAYSRQLLIQESFDVSAWLQNDLTAVLAVGLDLAAFDGTGASNQPTGVFRQTNVGTATFTGANGGIPTFAELVAFRTTLANANSDEGSSISWVTNPSVRGKLQTVLKSTTAGAAYIWSDDDKIAGLPAFASKQIPANYTAGTSTTVASGVCLGRWTEALLGFWGPGFEVVVDPYTSANQGMVNCTSFVFADIAVRHPASFVVNKTALIV
jgi:HK97 family phage major capsid protein